MVADSGMPQSISSRGEKVVPVANQFSRALPIFGLQNSNSNPATRESACETCIVAGVQEIHCESAFSRAITIEEALGLVDAVVRKQSKQPRSVKERFYIAHRDLHDQAIGEPLAGVYYTPLYLYESSGLVLAALKGLTTRIYPVNSIYITQPAELRKVCFYLLKL